MMKSFLQELLEECEREHKRCGLPADTWSEWYASYMVPRLTSWSISLKAIPCVPYVPQADARDGVTEG